MSTQPQYGAPRNPLAEPVIFVKQQIRLVNLEYDLGDPLGARTGSVAQVGQNALTAIGKIVGGLDRILQTTLEIRDSNGQPVLRIDKPLMEWNSANVTLPDGSPVGQIRKQFRIGLARFDLHDPSGNRLGGAEAKNLIAREFNFHDANGTGIARVTKKWSGVGRELFTTSDNYVIEAPLTIPNPLRLLVIASTLSIDILMKQKRGGMLGGVGDMFNG
ncbi:MAG: hypothetical protein QOC60_87 [Frankiaceae bacterium]|jgi:uncharacterized protein YxjI|nr:hypothetical protein [Frankiaceae bacterium]MDQ1714142.1 hypothetical protein [Frankiaceae bacterium]